MDRFADATVGTLCKESDNFDFCCLNESCKSTDAEILQIIVGNAGDVTASARVFSTRLMLLPAGLPFAPPSTRELAACMVSQLRALHLNLTLVTSPMNVLPSGVAIADSSASSWHSWTRHHGSHFQTVLEQQELSKHSWHLLALGQQMFVLLAQ
jgi:hypothetical protein